MNWWLLILLVIVTLRHLATVARFHRERSEMYIEICGLNAELKALLLAIKLAHPDPSESGVDLD